MKLISIFPLLIAGFFLCTSIDIVHNIIQPMENDMRLLSIGVLLVQVCAFCVFASISIVLFKVLPWRT